MNKVDYDSTNTDISPQKAVLTTHQWKFSGEIWWKFFGKIWNFPDNFSASHH